MAMMRERKRPAVWPVMLLALPAFVAIWSGWVGLGELTGFGVVHPLPGIVDSFSLNTAITLPIGVETYAAYALSVWLAGGAPGPARRFARWSAIGSLVFGGAGQVAYHLLTAAGVTHAPWWITTAVACLPVAVLGMGAALAHLVHAEDAPAVAPAAVEPVDASQLRHRVSADEIQELWEQLDDEPAPAQLVEPDLVDVEREPRTTEDLKPSRTRGRTPGRAPRPAPARRIAGGGGRTKVDTMRAFFAEHIAEHGEPPGPAAMDRAAGTNGVAKKYRPRWVAELTEAGTHA